MFPEPIDELGLSVPVQLSLAHHVTSKKKNKITLTNDSIKVI